MSDVQTYQSPARSWAESPLSAARAASGEIDAWTIDPFGQDLPPQATTQRLITLTLVIAFLLGIAGGSIAVVLRSSGDRHPQVTIAQQAPTTP
ncbi:MAG: hypothetical protein JNL54_12825 [Kineosporiaceae bacterium]|nr:hypothetical protein [Kineosporiaceae bacterium]